jgi:hypothetical protein
MKECYSEILGGNMAMPPEVLEILPQGKKLYIYTDSERGTVAICAKDPANLPNKWYFDAMAEMHAEENWDAYSEPVAPK